MPADPWDDPAAVAWAEMVLTDMAPKMRDSTSVVSLAPDDQGDVKFWVETGAAIMMDKPIITVVMGERPLPPKLEAVSDEIIRLPEGVTPDGSDELAAALRKYAPQ